MSDTVLLDDQPTVAIVSYEIPPAGLNIGLQVYGSSPLGVINGINATFQAQHNFIPETLVVYVNGLRQKIIDDYQTSGTQTVVLSASPVLGENVLFDYIRSS